MSLRTTGMPAELITWAISPPMVPAPTTAALKTNMAARLQRGFCGRFRGEAPERADEGVGKRPANEEGVGHRAQRPALLELVVQLHEHLAHVEPEGLGAGQPLLEDLRDEGVVGELDHALGHAPASRRDALPGELRARLGP